MSIDATQTDRNIRTRSHSNLTSAIEKSWASLIPSPTKATLLLSCSFWMALSSFWGEDIGNDGINSLDRQMPGLPVGYPPLTWQSLSPVLWAFDSFFELALWASWMAIKPITWPSTAKLMTVLACFLQIFHPFFAQDPLSHHGVCHSQGHQLLIDLALDSFPSIAWKFSTGFSSARDKIACARGCSESFKVSCQC